MCILGEEKFLTPPSCGISSVVERQPSKLNVRGSNPLFRSREISSAVECLVYTEVVTGSIPVSPIQVQTNVKSKMQRMQYRIDK